MFPFSLFPNDARSLATVPPLKFYLVVRLVVRRPMTVTFLVMGADQKREHRG
jgi:hypothetical protein